MLISAFGHHRTFDGSARAAVQFHQTGHSPHTRNRADGELARCGQKLPSNERNCSAEAYRNVGSFKIISLVSCELCVILAFGMSLVRAFEVASASEQP